MIHSDIDVYRPAREKYFYRLLLTTYQFDFTNMPMATTRVLGVYSDEESLNFDYYDTKVEPGQTIIDSISQALRNDFRVGAAVNIIAVENGGYARDSKGIERPKFIVTLESDNFPTEGVKPSGWVTHWVKQDNLQPTSKAEREQMIASFGDSYVAIAETHAAMKLPDSMQHDTGEKIVQVLDTLMANRVLLRNDRHVAMLGSYFGNILVKSGYGQWVADDDAPFGWLVRHISGSNFKPFELIDELVYGGEEQYSIFKEAVNLLPQMKAMTPNVDMRTPAAKVADGDKVHYQEFFVNLAAAADMPDNERIKVIERSGYAVDNNGYVTKAEQA